MSTNKPNNAAVVESCTARIHALQSKTQPATEIAVNGTRYKVSDLMAIYQACLDTRASLAKTRGQLGVDLDATRKADESRRAIDHGLKLWVIAQYGPNSAELREFGYGLPKARSITAEAKLHAVRLAKATREARHTMGKRQKKEVKGTLTPPPTPAGSPPANGTSPPHGS